MAQAPAHDPDIAVDRGGLRPVRPSAGSGCRAGAYLGVAAPRPAVHHVEIRDGAADRLSQSGRGGAGSDAGGAADSEGGLLAGAEERCRHSRHRRTLVCRISRSHDHERPARNSEKDAYRRGHQYRLRRALWMEGRGPDSAGDDVGPEGWIENLDLRYTGCHFNGRARERQIYRRQLQLPR